MYVFTFHEETTEQQERHNYKRPKNYAILKESDLQIVDEQIALVLNFQFRHTFFNPLKIRRETKHNK